MPGGHEDAAREDDWPAGRARPCRQAAQPRARVTALEDPALIRQALTACARTITGKAAATIQRRKRAVFRHRTAPGPVRFNPGAAAQPLPPPGASSR
jgi:hypothetical protein